MRERERERERERWKFPRNIEIFYILREPSVRLLQPAGNSPSIVEMDKMKETANFFLACQKMKEGRHEEAIASFKDQRGPYASFYIGEIYKKLALEEKAGSGMLEAGGKARELLVESREAFYLTLDRLRSEGGVGHPGLLSAQSRPGGR